MFQYTTNSLMVQILTQQKKATEHRCTHAKHGKRTQGALQKAAMEHRCNHTGHGAEICNATRRFSRLRVRHPALGCETLQVGKAMERATDHRCVYAKCGMSTQRALPKSCNGASLPPHRIRCGESHSKAMRSQAENASDQFDGPPLAESQQEKAHVGKYPRRLLSLGPQCTVMQWPKDLGHLDFCEYQ